MAMAMNRPEQLHERIGRLRDAARVESTDAPVSGRPQMNEIDGTIALAAHLSSQGIKGVERRQAMKDVRPGMTVTGRGAEKTRSTRAEKIARAQAWGATLTEEQRDEYVQGEKFDALSDRQQELISEAFSEIADKAYSDSIGIADYDFDQPSVDIDQLPEDETESVGDSFGVLEGEDVQSFDIDDADPWPGDAV
jgi:hypothetical protein